MERLRIAHVDPLQLLSCDEQPPQDIRLAQDPLFPPCSTSADFSTLHVRRKDLRFFLSTLPNIWSGLCRMRSQCVTDVRRSKGPSRPRPQAVSPLPHIAPQTSRPPPSKALFPSGQCTPVIFERECHWARTFNADAEQREQDKKLADPVLPFSHRQRHRSGRQPFHFPRLPNMSPSSGRTRRQSSVHASEQQLRVAIPSVRATKRARAAARAFEDGRTSVAAGAVKSLQGIRFRNVRLRVGGRARAVAIRSASAG